MALNVQTTRASRYPPECVLLPLSAPQRLTGAEPSDQSGPLLHPG